MANEKRLTTEEERASLIRCLKMRHDAQFTPGVYEHSIIGRAALFLEETVDAVEVVHGRWIEDVATDMIACTECGHAWNIIDNCTETFNYCPNCGAKMDGGNEDV